MEIAIPNRRTRPQRWTVLLALVSAAALLAAGTQLLAPAPARAMTEEEGAGDPQCQLWWFFEICEEEEQGGGGGGPSDGGSSGDGSYDGDDVCAELGHCSSGDSGDQGGGSSGGSSAGDPHDDICARYGACEDSVKDKGWEPMDGWDALDEEEADEADEALGKADRRALERGMLRRAGESKRACDDRFRSFVSAAAGEEEDRAFQRLHECLLEHRHDPGTAARPDRAKKDRPKRFARRPGGREPDAVARRG